MSFPISEATPLRFAPTLPKACDVVVLGGGLRPALPPRQGVEVAEGGDRLLRGVLLLAAVKAGCRCSSRSPRPAPSRMLW